MKVYTFLIIIALLAFVGVFSYWGGAYFERKRGMPPPVVKEVIKEVKTDCPVCQPSMAECPVCLADEQIVARVQFLQQQCLK